MKNTGEEIDQTGLTWHQAGMARQTQKRTLETRARLVAVASDLVAQGGYTAMRIEEVVQGAGVAKGTFFSHFKDKDALMDLLIGARIDAYLDELEAVEPPQTIEDLVKLQLPLLQFMSSERYVFDVILRLSGAAAVSDVGPIAMTFERYIAIARRWFEAGTFRTDVSADLLAEGMQAFVTQALALNFCALHGDQTLSQRLIPYLRAWLQPGE